MIIQKVMIRPREKVKSMLLYASKKISTKTSLALILSLLTIEKLGEASFNFKRF